MFMHRLKRFLCPIAALLIVLVAAPAAQAQLLSASPQRGMVCFGGQGSGVTWIAALWDDLPIPPNDFPRTLVVPGTTGGTIAFVANLVTAINTVGTGSTYLATQLPPPFNNCLAVQDSTFVLANFAGWSAANGWCYPTPGTPCMINPEIHIPEADDDQDGFVDAAEAFYGLDWDNPDTDGDGLLDGEDNCPLKSRYEQSDDSNDADVCGDPSNNSGSDDGDG